MVIRSKIQKRQSASGAISQERATPIYFSAGYHSNNCKRTLVFKKWILSHIFQLLLKLFQVKGFKFTISDTISLGIRRVRITTLSRTADFSHLQNARREHTVSTTALMTKSTIFIITLPSLNLVSAEQPMMRLRRFATMRLLERKA